MKRALLVGIDHYDRFGSLDGCANDVNALEALLSRNEDNSPNFDCQKRTSLTGGVTRDELLGDLDGLLDAAADVALLYFAGHGAGPGTDRQKERVRAQSRYFTKTTSLRASL